MPLILRVILLLATITLSAPASAQAYQLEGPWHVARWKPGSWLGEHRLPSVYCLKFPAADSALELGHGFYNRNTIYLTQVLYPEKTGAFIAVSSVPPGRSGDEEITRLLSLERNAEAAYGTPYNIAEIQTAFGRTIGMRIRNIGPQGGNAPFPLVRALLRSPRAPIETVSVYRIFVRGSDRFEVATLQIAPPSAGEGTEAEMTRRLTVLADEIVSSLQSCTGSMPARTPR